MSRRSERGELAKRRRKRRGGAEKVDNLSTAESPVDPIDDDDLTKSLNE